MAILGSIIKGIIDLKDSLFSESSPIKDQQKVLIQLLETAKDRSFGKYYDFSQILESDDIIVSFANAILCHDYNAIKGRWSSRVLDF